MGKYVYAYRGGGGMADSPAETEKAMAEWGAWFGRLGAAVVDGGAPFAGSKVVASTGQAGAASGLTGYSIVSASSLEEAAKLTDGCPVLASGGTVDVYECIDMG